MSRIAFDSVTARPKGLAGRLFGTLFFGVFLGMGLLFAAFIAGQVWRDALTYAWTKVECVILDSRLHDQGGESPYRFDARFQYEWQGQTYTSDRVATQGRTFSDYAKGQRLVLKYSADSKSVCYVNPRTPSEAILMRGNLALGLFIFLPLIFVMVGGVGIYAMWKRPGAPAKPAPLRLKPKATAAMAKASVAFFGVFALAGAGGMYLLLVRPALKIVDARDWAAVPCTVVSSRVTSHSSDDGTTYRVDILYAYEVDGRELRANRYHFVGGSSSGYAGKARVVARYPAGAKTTCYVNPQDPNEAVLHRGFTPVMWFGLLPGLFLVIGIAGMCGKLGTFGARSPSRSQAGNADPPLNGPVILKPKASPVAKFVGGLIFSLFWNGIVSVFLVHVFQMWRTGRGGGEKWFLSLFLIPFVLIGLGLIWFTVHSFCGLFSPRVRVRLSQRSVALGESVELSWEFAGGADKVRDLHLQLEGREERDEGSGKSRRTNTDVFYKADIAHFTNANDVRSGTVLCTLPSDQLPSDDEGAQRVVWSIKLKATVDFGADLDDEYSITVVANASTMPLPERRAI